MRTKTSASGISQLSNHKIKSKRKVCNEISVTRKLEGAPSQEVLVHTYICTHTHLISTFSGYLATLNQKWSGYSG
jgi:hypothetical protein